MLTMIKVGGSLFDLPDLSDRLRTVIRATGAAATGLVPGGGTAADVVRGWDAVFKFPAEVSHQLAVDSMSLSTQLLLVLLPESRVAESLDEARHHWSDGRIVIFKPAPCMQRIEERQQVSMPSGWHVTSDSIAAWLANHAGADQLVLAKSVDPPAVAARASFMDESNHDQTRIPPEVRSTDAVDPFFAQLAPRIPSIGWVNLRSTPDRIITWQQHRSS